MIQEVKLVKIGLTMETGKITLWHKKEGEYIKEGEPFFDVETDKATQTVESFHTGYVKRLLVSAGEEVPVNTAIALIGDRDDPLPE
jgi:pyruvate dehydrogenase E2 component (dihydrolipoamide acetyltransferase)